MKAVLGVIAFVLLLVIAAGIYYYNTYNKLVRLQEEVQKAWSNVDVQLKRRANLIPNLVNTVKGYAQHEKGIFEYVAKARSQLINAKTPQDEIQASNRLEGAIGRLLMIVERYPELKASEEFTRLMDNLEGTENRIAVARQRYNNIVAQYNATIKSVPANIIAKKMGLRLAPYFTITNRQEKQPPKVNFGNSTSSLEIRLCAA